MLLELEPALVVLPVAPPPLVAEPLVDEAEVPLGPEEPVVAAVVPVAPLNIPPLLSSPPQWRNAHEPTPSTKMGYQFRRPSIVIGSPEANVAEARARLTQVDGSHCYLRPPSAWIVESTSGTRMRRDGRDHRRRARRDEPTSEWMSVDDCISLRTVLTHYMSPRWLSAAQSASVAAHGAVPAWKSLKPEIGTETKCAARSTFSTE